MDFDDETKRIRLAPPGARDATNDADKPREDDSVVVVRAEHPTLLGKRFVLEHNPTHIGRGLGNHIVLDDDAVSSRHAHLEQRAKSWIIVDDGSATGTYRNDKRIASEVRLEPGDRVKIGSTILKFLPGADVEAMYHEELYRMTTLDGLTKIHNKRYLHEAIEREMRCCRRQQSALSILLFDIDDLKRINDAHGRAAGDFVLADLARVVSVSVRRDDVFGRFGGDEFAMVLKETSLEEATALGEALRQKVREHAFAFEANALKVTLSLGATLLEEIDGSANDLLKRADSALRSAKRQGGDRIVTAR